MRTTRRGQNALREDPKLRGTARNERSTLGLRTGALVLALSSLFGCGSGSGSDSEGTTDAGPSVVVLLDDEELTNIAHAALEPTPKRLIDLLDGAAGDPVKWVLVEAKGPEWRQMTVSHPLTMHRDADISMSMGEDGKVRFGLYPHAAPTRPRLLLEDLVRVHVRTVELPPPARVVIEAAILKIKVGDGQAQMLTDDQLEKIPGLERTSGGDGSRGEPKTDPEGLAKDSGHDGTLRRVFHLADLLAPFVTVEEVSSVRLVGDDPAKVMTVTAELLGSREGSLPIIKRNTKGQWNFQERSSDPMEARAMRSIRVVEVELP